MSKKTTTEAAPETVAAAPPAPKPSKIKIPKLASKGKTRMPRKQKKAMKAAAGKRA